VKGKPEAGHWPFRSALAHVAPQDMAWQNGLAALLVSQQASGATIRRLIDSLEGDLTYCFSININ